MKMKFKHITMLLLVVCMMISTVGCGSYKFNYKNSDYKFQYDENLLIVSDCESEDCNDVFVHTADGYYISYVDISIIQKNYGEPRVLLDNMQSYFVSVVDNGNVIDEEVVETTGRHGKTTKNIVELNYRVTSDDGLIQNVQSRVETIGMTQFIVVYRYYEGSYTEKTLNALQVAYDSATLNK